MQPSDEALILACRRGDEAAWEQLVARYQRLIYAIPRRSGLSEDAAAEVFQHVFVTLLEQLDRIEQPARVGAWLVTTARRETWRVSRRARAGAISLDAARQEGAGEPLDPPDDEPLPEQVVVRLEEQHAVRTALASLDDRCRTLIELLFYRPDPPPYEEVAAQLGTTAGSIGPTRARCLQKLRRALDQLGVTLGALLVACCQGM